MKIVILGLSLSSSWGNGHATTYRAVLRILGQRHDILFLERDQPWYAENRDLPDPDFCRLVLYRDGAELAQHRSQIESADAVIIGSYVPEGAMLAAELRSWVRGAFCFYDIDTPVTLAKLREGGAGYISAETIPLFDLYLSFTGGPTLRRLVEEFGARRAVPLYCSVDELRYRPLPVRRRWDLGYLGTYSPDRQVVLERLLVEPARRLPDHRFVVAGPTYPADIAWPENIERIEHLPPEAHPEFYNAQAWTLNITRAHMVSAGYSPSVRLFEASACGAPIISDSWPGLETIFHPDKEIIVADGTREVIAALAMAEDERARIGKAGRMRCLAEHTAGHRATDLETAIFAGASPTATNGRWEGVPA
jgi:spore maturation protein CgeB